MYDLTCFNDTHNNMQWLSRLKSTVLVLIFGTLCWKMKTIYQDITVKAKTLQIFAILTCTSNSPRKTYSGHFFFVCFVFSNTQFLKVKNQLWLFSFSHVSIILLWCYGVQHYATPGTSKALYQRHLCVQCAPLPHVETFVWILLRRNHVLWKSATLPNTASSHL